MRTVPCAATTARWWTIQACAGMRRGESGMAEYIEREALVHHFMTTRQYLAKDLVMDAAYEVSKFPAADVAPVVHGRWIPFRSEAAGDIQYCSACDIGCTWMPNYCPNCGARMDGE